MFGLYVLGWAHGIMGGRIHYGRVSFSQERRFGTRQASELFSFTISADTEELKPVYIVIIAICTQSNIHLKELQLAQTTKPASPLCKGKDTRNRL
jgi:hypothetical protein